MKQFTHGEMACVSYVYPKVITRQTIINNQLVTEFNADTDPEIGHPAGKIVCEPCTQAQAIAWEERFGTDFGGVLSDTVTRFGKLFWDAGVYTQ
jgi:hypothetical protein